MLWHCRLADSKDIQPAKSWMLVCWWRQFDWSFAYFTAPVVTTMSIIRSASKIQNGDILAPVYPGCHAWWPLNECLVECRRFSCDPVVKQNLFIPTDLPLRSQVDLSFGRFFDRLATRDTERADPAIRRHDQVSRTLADSSVQLFHAASGLHWSNGPRRQKNVAVNIMPSWRVSSVACAQRDSLVVIPIWVFTPTDTHCMIVVVRYLQCRQMNAWHNAADRMAAQH